MMSHEGTDYTSLIHPQPADAFFFFCPFFKHVEGVSKHHWGQQEVKTKYYLEEGVNTGLNMMFSADQERFFG